MVEYVAAMEGRIWSDLMFDGHKNLIVTTFRDHMLKLFRTNALCLISDIKSPDFVFDNGILLLYIAFWSIDLHIIWILLLLSY